MKGTSPASKHLMVFLHGWPEIGLLWRAQLDYFAAAGWRCVAPDMRQEQKLASRQVPDVRLRAHAGRSTKKRNCSEAAMRSSVVDDYG